MTLHERLNPDLWEGGDYLKVPVRRKLLEIAWEWASFAKIPQSAVSDVLLCGGNANYNYTTLSDIDVHLVVDRASLGFSSAELTDSYLKAMKTLWSLTRSPRVAGFPVELYAQDAQERHPAGQGVYSIYRGEWEVHPDHPDALAIPTWEADVKAADLRHQVDYAISSGSTDDVVSLKKKIAGMRRAGLASGGEFSVENLAFKSLRDDGVLQKITDFLKREDDARLSL